MDSEQSTTGNGIAQATTIDIFKTNGLSQQSTVGSLPDFLRPKPGVGLTSDSVSPVLQTKRQLWQLCQKYGKQLPRLIVAVVGFGLVAFGWTQLYGETNAVVGKSVDGVANPSPAPQSAASDVVYSSETMSASSSDSDASKSPIKNTEIVVNVSGAVKRSGLYNLVSPARIGQAIDAAGGLHTAADVAFVQKQLNLAGVLQDGDKVYVPYQGEIELGKMIAEFSQVHESSLEENPKAISPGSSPPEGQGEVSDSLKGKISINSATQAALDELPGIGVARATAIIDGRPYQSIAELVTRKVLPQSIYAQIESYIGL